MDQVLVVSLRAPTIISFFQDIWLKFKYLIEIKHLKSSFATEKTFCVCHHGDLNR
jgi:hypothetical protein